SDVYKRQPCGAGGLVLAALQVERLVARLLALRVPSGHLRAQRRHARGVGGIGVQRREVGPRLGARTAPVDGEDAHRHARAGPHGAREPERDRAHLRHGVPRADGPLRVHHARGPVRRHVRHGHHADARVVGDRQRVGELRAGRGQRPFHVALPAGHPHVA
ncbi:MAG: hypothetical protein ACK559_16535, partial [bacterium]